MNEIFTVLVHQPVFNILMVFYKVLGENLGLAIIGIALLSRLILLPLAIRQNRMLKQNQEFSEKVKTIKKTHKEDKKKQQEEMMKIQSEYLPSQIAGCLPLIVQFILLITINNVFTQIFTNPSQFTEVFSQYAYGPLANMFPPGYVLNTAFLGMDLNVHPNTLGFGTPEIIPYLILIALVGITQYYSVKVMQPKKKEDENKDGKNNGKDKKDKKGKKENPAEDFSETLQKTTQQTMLLLPIMIMAASYSLAAGLSVYWVSQSTFVIIQQKLLMRYKKPDKEVSK